MNLNNVQPYRQTLLDYLAFIAIGLIGFFLHAALESWTILLEAVLRIPGLMLVLVIFVGITHLFGKLFKLDNVEATLQALVYGSAPLTIFESLPAIALIMAYGAIPLTILLLTRYHNTTWLKATGMLLIPQLIIASFILISFTIV